jgi:hypothetical protein
MIGTKPAAEAADLFRTLACVISGRRAFHMSRSRVARIGGLYGSDYADMSNEKQGENPCRRNPKVSWARFVLLGLVGPLAEAERRR